MYMNHSKVCWAEEGRRTPFFASTSPFLSCSHFFTPPSYHPPSWMLNGEKCPERWVRMNSFLLPGAKCTDPTWRGGPQWSSDLWPSELIETNDLMRCSYEGGDGSIRRKRDGWKTTVPTVIGSMVVLHTAAFPQETSQVNAHGSPLTLNIDA